MSVLGIFAVCAASVLALAIVVLLCVGSYWKRRALRAHAELERRHRMGYLSWNPVRREQSP